MCGTCGCSKEHTHEHGSEHNHTHAGADRDTRRIEVERKVLAKNDHAAMHNREFLTARNIFTINLISSPGSGKTTLLEDTLLRLSKRISSAVIVGDQCTDNDARRLSGRGAEVRQIETGGTCHLEAESVGIHISAVVSEETQLLFIENVGNLICPAMFDLGENCKVALLSVTEGEDKPLKYPVLFSKADVVIITKTDLSPHLEWDRDAAVSALGKTCPKAKIFELSAKTGEGMDAWIAFLTGQVSKSASATESAGESPRCA